VTSVAPPPLKLYVEQPPKSVCPPAEAVGSLPAVLNAFESATGWSLRHLPDRAAKFTGPQKASIPLRSGAGMKAGSLLLEPSSASFSSGDPPPVPFDTAFRLAESLGKLLDELQQTRHALWQREAEIASHVPLPPPTSDDTQLAESLQAAVRGGAEAVNGQAAGLYLLDEATTELKLRSSWGLPFERLAEPGRPLKGCLPDLEALLGHAVVLENTALMPGWTAPENFPAAVCVPVSSPTALLGTYWVFCREARDFTDQQVNMLEIAAGKIAGDLERETLRREGSEATGLKKQWAAAQRLQRHQLPPAMPLFDGWDIAGGILQSQDIGGAAYDWFCLPDGILAFAAVECLSRGFEAVLTAGAVRSAVRAHGQYHRRPVSALQQVNLTLWTGSAGDQFAASVYGLIETAAGNIRWTVAGQPSLVLLHDTQWKSLTVPAPLLGESPESEFSEQSLTLEPGETLVVATPGFLDALDAHKRRFGESGLADLLARNAGLPATELAALACESLRPLLRESSAANSALLVIKRRPSRPSNA
jgi:phosphoserine phosphatase RsbU/P